MSLQDYDVVVVGGGSSGIWAAGVAAGEGARTLLVERNRRIGEQIRCAEGVGARGIQLLVDLEDQWVAARIDGVRMFTPEGKEVKVDQPGCGYVLYKDLFLQGLCRMAAERGVEIWLDSEVLGIAVRDSGGLELEIRRPAGGCRLRAGAVIAADGIESRLGRTAGIQEGLKPQDLFACAQYLVAPIEMDPRFVEVYFGWEVAPGGYAWVFPKGQARANVGVGVVNHWQAAKTPLEYLREFKQRRCPQAQVLGQVFGGVPSVKRPYRAFGHGVFLAGDAARVADPASGAGIIPGMESAGAAARAAYRYCRDGGGKRAVERGLVRELKTIYRDRRIRYAVRTIMGKMSDRDLGRMIELTGQYATHDDLLGGNPLKLIGFMVKSMPRTFGLIRHLVRG
jgi:digeranylgeranylglycerophospholipid reductase